MIRIFTFILYLCVITKGFSKEYVPLSTDSGHHVFYEKNFNNFFDFSKTENSNLTDFYTKVDAQIQHVKCLVNGISSNDGGIDLTVIGFTGVISYEWSTTNGSGLNETSEDQTGLSAGTYKVSITDESGVCVHKQYTVCNPRELIIDACITNNICFGAEDGIIQVHASGGTKPYLYSKDNGETFVTDNIFSGLKSGDYTIVLKDKNNCEISEIYTIIDEDVDLIITTPSNFITDSCATQDQITTEFSNWISQFTYSGGTNVIESGLDNVFPPATCGGEITVKYSVKDDCHTKESEATFTVPISDLDFGNEAESIEIECDGIDINQSINNWLNNNGGATIISSCNENVTWSNNFNENNWTIECGNVKYVDVTFNATDDCNHSINTSARFSIKDTTDPTFVEQLPNDINLSCGDVPDSVTLTAIDNCDNDVSVVLSESISGENTCGSEYIITRIWTATDCSGNSISHTQTITIEDTVDPSFVEQLPNDINLSCGDVPDAVTLTTTDNCDNDVSVVLSESISGENTCGSEYIITRIWTATDCSGNSISHTQTITIEDTVDPSFVEQLPNDINLSCGDVLDAVTLTATDNCDNDVSVVLSESISGENTCGSEYIITRIWTATDCSGNSISHTQTITVDDTVDPSFVEQLPNDINLSCGDVPDAVTLTATDNCDNDVSVVLSESISGENVCGSEYIITRTWTATDCSGNSISHTQTITVDDNVDPSFVEQLPNNVTLSCGDAPNAVTLTATDNCDNDVEVNLSESISGENACGSEYIITRIWTATDCSGNSTSHTQRITIEDTVDPSFVEQLPNNITLACGDIPDAVTLTATDNCDNDVEVNLSESISGENACGSEYIITRIWTATDCAGNSVSHTQRITIEDTVDPVLVGQFPVDITLSCEDSLPLIPIITATDNCDNDVEAIFNEVIIGDDGACGLEYILARTWIATDCAGNSTSYTQNITVQNGINFPILITSYNSVINVNSCNNIPPAPVLEFENTCIGETTVNYREVIRTDGFNDRYQIIRTWLASDPCGNSIQYRQTVNVRINDINTLQEQELCIDDISVSLNNYLPSGIDLNGTWEAASSNSQLDGTIFDPAIVPLGIHNFVYTTSDLPCPSIYEISINVHDDCSTSTCSSEDQVKISRAITPNGDPYNEYFLVKGVEECGFTIEVQIFDRWGGLVYESNNYQNNWNGSSNNGNVPEGTYFYIVNLKNSGFNVFRASLEIVR